MKNKGLYETCGMAEKVDGTNYNIVEWMKRNTWRSYGHDIGLLEKRMVKSVN